MGTLLPPPPGAPSGLPPPPTTSEAPPGAATMPGPDAARRGLWTRVRWHPVEALPVFLVAVVVGSLLVIPFALLDDSKSFVYVVATIASEAAFGIVVLMWIRLGHKTPVSVVGRPRRPLADVGWGILAGGGLTLIAIIAGIVFQAIATAILGHTPKQPTQIPDYVSGASLIASGFAVIVAAPFGEELLFRGFLYRSLRGRLRLWPAALIASFAFALVHVAPLLIFAIFFVGLGLAFVYEWRRSILASMAAHATFNLIGFLTIFLGRR